MRRPLIVLACGLAVGLATWLGVQGLGAWRFDRELNLVKREVGARRFALAGARLTRMAQQWPARGEIAYWLGVCEQGQGHDEAALSAWARVPDQAALAPLAALSRGRLAFETGRYRLAEKCLERAIRSGGEAGDLAAGCSGASTGSPAATMNTATSFGTTPISRKTRRKRCGCSGRPTTTPIRSTA